MREQSEPSQSHLCATALGDLPCQGCSHRVGLQQLLPAAPRQDHGLHGSFDPAIQVVQQDLTCGKAHAAHAFIKKGRNGQPRWRLELGSFQRISASSGKLLLSPRTKKAQRASTEALHIACDAPALPYHKLLGDFGRLPARNLAPRTSSRSGRAFAGQKRVGQLQLRGGLPSNFKDHLINYTSGDTKPATQPRPEHPATGIHRDGKLQSPSGKLIGENDVEIV